MKHKYLVQEGRWDLKGSYVTAGDGRHDAVGNTKFVHSPHEWTSSGELNILGDTPVSIPHLYSIAPMAEGADLTTWSCVDASEGVLRGTIAIVADSQISTFRADASDYYGVDVTRKVKDETYQSQGFIVREGAKISSWSLKVTRSSPAKPGRRTDKAPKR